MESFHKTLVRLFFVVHRTIKIKLIELCETLTNLSNKITFPLDLSMMLLTSLLLDEKNIFITLFSFYKFRIVFKISSY